MRLCTRDCKAWVEEGSMLCWRNVILFFVPDTNSRRMIEDAAESDMARNCQF